MTREIIQVPFSMNYLREKTENTVWGQRERGFFFALIEGTRSSASPLGQ